MAIKEFLTQAEMENGASRRGPEEGGVSSTDALQLFRDLRQEVSVLAELSHPNIVSLLGVSLRPMCIVIEFAPLGSLFGILDKRIDVIKSSQADAAITVPRMPGGVLGHMMSTKIALQVRGCTAVMSERFCFIYFLWACVPLSTCASPLRNSQRTLLHAPLYTLRSSLLFATFTGKVSCTVI